MLYSCFDAQGWLGSSRERCGSSALGTDPSGEARGWWQPGDPRATRPDVSSNAQHHSRNNSRLYERPLQVDFHDDEVLDRVLEVLLRFRSQERRGLARLRVVLRDPAVDLGERCWWGGVGPNEPLVEVRSVEKVSDEGNDELNRSVEGDEGGHTLKVPINAMKSAYLQRTQGRNAHLSKLAPRLEGPDVRVDKKRPQDARSHGLAVMESEDSKNISDEVYELTMAR